MSKSFTDIYESISTDKDNLWAKKKGYKPLYSASENSKIVIIGQAPGLKAQESMIPWNDASGVTLRE